MLDLKELREKIDKIDDEILELLNERMTYVKIIGEIKKNHNKKIYYPKREKAILDRLKNKNLENLDHNAIELIYNKIFFVARSLERF
ncbi:chorismate mutase [Campylobacter sp. RM10532]|uniref:Chorismate mutase n=1 Tax=Campylobacter molothri TaxID=1032242 RepID=A0ACC5W0S4_9BACT|nr:chorismate mutase [Campylobacter sp. 2018MI35]MBZ7927879.1 chorismate mutase [Campylobacter sp. RM10542]MBZ7929831.1 chorismate mutase [Campylobacter sp. W0067]MBZ7931217.1 chorismate mutase [Campylobacter sp. RM12910]MBZ7932671.1 chorismate mutase [Campylobacter sp. RM10543]MBZ7934200.1 chorismate mutase [Campylobacter sp. W0065]MBZ7937006.1 chorismate mutase [Campylobacter sp. RM10538]MBZ7940028.1 chorismate mutase [Campylobacter sp. W0047]MBZ7941874.1 chorismate mutase [Campylobacter 